ncbi:hypothetical protein ALC62_07905 [Cyphomyrmex costatus]|uniref:Uncharacterized protein n=1 Tax=Cyphomyrmex costatus TaxID=456900 RepID=A0A195CKN8_9HYME|nr:hypothetical protein ALC62_07905 [Cyphomyrmex costatus]
MRDQPHGRSRANSPLAGHGDNRMRARPRPVTRFQTLVESSIEREAEASRSVGFSQTIKTRKNRSANRIDREKSNRTRDSFVLGFSVSSRNDYRQLTITSLSTAVCFEKKSHRRTHDTVHHLYLMARKGGSSKSANPRKPPEVCKI